MIQEAESIKNFRYAMKTSSEEMVVLTQEHLSPLRYYLGRYSVHSPANNRLPCSMALRDP